MIKLILVDMSGTLLKGSGVNSVADYMGKGDTYRRLYPLYRSGEITMEKLLNESIACWRGFKESDLRKVYRKFQFTEGAKETLSEIKKGGIKSALLTNVPQNLGKLFQRDFGFDVISGTVCEVKDGVFTGKILEFHHDKAKEAQRIVDELGIEPKEALSIGDRKDDAEVFKLVGVGVSYNGDEIALRESDYQINDFMDLLGIIERENANM